MSTCIYHISVYVYDSLIALFMYIIHIYVYIYIYIYFYENKNICVSPAHDLFLSPGTYGSWKDPGTTKEESWTAHVGVGKV